MGADSSVRNPDAREIRTDESGRMPDFVGARVGMRAALRGIVPTTEHEALVDLFRSRPTLATELLRGRVDLPTTCEIEVIDPALNEMVGVELRADLVQVLVGPDGRNFLAIIVEVQRSEDARKKLAWPSYATVLRSRVQCFVEVLVVAPDPAVAAWASEPIPINQRSTFQPIVAGPRDVPRVTRAEALVPLHSDSDRFPPALFAGARVAASPPFRASRSRMARYAPLRRATTRREDCSAGTGHNRLPSSVCSRRSPTAARPAASRS
jgi:hypothetical protein